MKGRPVGMCPGPYIKDRPRSKRLATLIESTRGELRFTFDLLAERTGIPRRTLLAIANGDSRPVSRRMRNFTRAAVLSLRERHGLKV